MPKSRNLDTDDGADNVLCVGNMPRARGACLHPPYSLQFLLCGVILICSRPRDGEGSSARPRRCVPSPRLAIL